MYSLVELAHYNLIGFLVVAPGAAVAWGQGYAAQATTDAITRQPGARKALLSTFFIGAVLNETAALLSGIMGGILLFTAPPVMTFPYVLAEWGIGFALGVPALLVGYLGAFPHHAALHSVARQPFQSGRINYFIAFLLSVMQMSVILGLIIAFAVRLGINAGMAAHTLDTLLALQMSATGLAFGLATVGPLLGMQRFATVACSTLGKAPETYSVLVSFALISQALIETPILFALFIAFFILIYGAVHPWAAVASALAIGLATLGPGIASGMIASEACRSMGKVPEKAAALSYTSVLAQTLVDASVVYGVIIAAMLLFV